MTKIKFLSLVIALLATTFAFSQENNATLKINFSSKGKKGILYVAVYDNEADFMKNKLQKLQLDMTNGENAQLKIENLVEGKEYAITSFLDENDNKTLDKNAFGLPVEPYGFSNNTKGFFGPPSYEKVKVVLKEEKNPISIIVD